MSYCRFINTLADLEDCFEHMEDGISNAEEIEARKKLVQLCGRIHDCYEDIGDNDDEASPDMTDRTETLSGVLSLREYGEGEVEVLYCGDIIVVEWVVEALGGGHQLWTTGSRGKTVSIRYWIADTPGTSDELKMRALFTLYGVADANFGCAYSEITGYLWTDEEFKVGGHDMVGELSCSVGKYLLLEMVIHD
jgi:hypothetical protein